MNLARATDAAARKFVLLNFTGLLQTCTNSGGMGGNKWGVELRDMIN